MALLSVSERKKRFKFLGYEYNEDGIRKLQKKYLRAKDVDGIYGADTDRLLRHVYNVKKVTKNFAPEEFKCECGGKYCTGYPSYMKQVELKNLQSIRSHYGKPLVVTCGLRCRTYNNKLAGSIANSKHLTGYATDFYMKGVTDTLANRRAAIKWIKKLPNHNYTYGNGYNSNGFAVKAPYMGNALHTDTNEPPAKAKTPAVKTPTLTDKLLDACKTQAEWMKNSKYAYEKNPTIEKSKKKGTCVTFVSCVLQRINILKSGQSLWHNEAGKVYGNNDKMTVIYPKNKTLHQLKSELKAGDIIMDGSGVGSNSHIFILTGKWNGNNPIIWDNHSGQQGKGAYEYTRNRNVIAVVRLK